MSNTTKRVELVIAPSRSHHPRSGKLSVRLRSNPEGSIRDAIRDAGFKEGDWVVELAAERPAGSIPGRLRDALRIFRESKAASDAAYEAVRR